MCDGLKTNEQCDLLSLKFTCYKKNMYFCLVIFNNVTVLVRPVDVMTVDDADWIMYVGNSLFWKGGVTFTPLLDF